jgi:hypothetical protein
MPQSSPSPWWLLPNRAALDAPLVAAVWQRFLAGRFGVTVPWAATAALTATVWGIYLADRWFDARRGDCPTDRHRTAARRPRLFAGGIAVAIGLAAAAATRLPAGYIRCGSAVAVGVASYLGLVHLAADGLKSLPGMKEFLVGLGFAAGVAVPLWAAGPSASRWLPCVVVFGGLCWLNCRLIDRWESGADASWSDGLLAIAVLAGSAGLPIAVGQAIIAAAVGLLAVHLFCRRFPRPARVLADAVLLTPLAVPLAGWALS